MKKSNTVLDYAVSKWFSPDRIRDTLRDLIIFVPILHLTFCFIFIFFYCAGFGNGIENFFSYSDAFSVSMRDLSWAYLALIAQILFLVPLMERMEMAGSGEGARAVKEFFDGAFFAYIFIYISIAGFVLFLIVRMFLIFNEVSSWLLATFFIIVLGTLASLKLKANRNPLRALLTLFIGVPFLASAYLGISKGFFDAYSSIPRNDVPAAKCGGRVVLRSIGEYYLTYDKSGAKYLIDKECKDRFNLISDERYQTEIKKYEKILQF